MLSLASLTSGLPDAVASHFVLLWLLSLIVIAICGYWLSQRSTSILPRLSRSARVLPVTSVDVAALILFGLFLAFYVSVILYKEDFAFFDNDQFTDFSVAGRALPPPIWPTEGRFFPLAFQEFNALRFITRSPVGYQLFAVVQLLVVLLVLSAALGGFRLRYRLLLLSALMLAPAFSISFTGLVYPERDVLFWLAIMLFCLQRYSKTSSAVSFVSCLICAHFALYYKETVVVFIAAFAISYLLFHLCSEISADRQSWRKFAKENVLYFGLLAVCAAYVTFFLAAMHSWGNSSYVAEHQQPIGSVFKTYLVIDWMAWLLLAVFLFRLVRWLSDKDELDPPWDSLAVGALAYFFAILALRLISSYYLAPVDLVAFVYLGRFALTVLPTTAKLGRALGGTVFVCLLVHDAAYSSFRVIERKSLIVESHRLADFLEGYLPKATGSAIDLYFPYATRHQLATLSAYLKYRGLPIAQSGFAKPSTGPQFIIESPAEFTANKCVEYSVYRCVHGDRPRPGALLVVMPDDHVDMGDVRELARNSTLLFRLDPPACCSSKSSSLRFLYVISPEFAATGLPEHWLQLDIFQARGAGQEKLRIPDARNHDS
jgi:hypothetical protein